ncbi:MAG: hypothetical protein SGARI_001910 [Bacillariaceae sp.]
MDGFLETFLYTKHVNVNPSPQTSAFPLQKPTSLSGIPSVLPGAVSLGSTPCMASSSPMKHYPGGFLHQVPSDDSKPSCRELYLEEIMEQRDGAPSPDRLDERRQRRFSSLPEDAPKVAPWGKGIPGRVDHGIGVIGSRRKSIVPSLDPIASFSTCTTENTSNNEDDNLLNISMSSQLSPIPTDEEGSIIAFDYPFVKPEARLNPFGVSTGAANVSDHTPSLFDDALLDTSSMDGNDSRKKPNYERKEHKCGQETIMNILFCRAMESTTPFLGKESKEQQVGKQSAGAGLCGCRDGEGKEYSLESFLKEAWI